MRVERIRQTATGSRWSREMPHIALVLPLSLLMSIGSLRICTALLETAPFTSFFSMNGATPFRIKLADRQIGITAELQADCYAGAALMDVVRNGQLQLEAGDPGEVINVLYQGGDPAGVPWLAPTAHGTAGQRINAFALGNEKGPEACYNTYQ
jgi:hypothetical protein